MDLLEISTTKGTKVNAKNKEGKPSVSHLWGERDHAEGDFDKFSVTPQTSQLKASESSDSSGSGLNALTLDL